MSFMLDQELLSEDKELTKTRAIAEKALSTINFREEAEKLNIWIALMNLEHAYGSEESLQDVIDRALSAMDQVKVYRHLASMYCEAGKDGHAVRVYEVMIKKFKTVSFVTLLLATPVLVLVCGIPAPCENLFCFVSDLLS
jgi:rRNA biogenesis protein RRP5